MTYTAFLIRSNGDPDRALRLLDKAQGIDNLNAYVVLDCTAGAEAKESSIVSACGSENVIKLTMEFITQFKLAYFARATWQCGDYFYYRAYEAFPNYDYYWLSDDDVEFGVDFDSFITKSCNVECDLLGMEVGRRGPNWSWYKSMASKYPDAVYGMLYPLSRLSNRALKLLFEKRSLYKSDLPESVYHKSRALISGHANDEAFTATTLINNGYTARSLYQEFKGPLSGYFSTERPILNEELGMPHLAEKIIHPVCTRARAREKFNIMYAKYGPEKMLKRAEEITEFCGEAVWLDCFDKTVHELRAEVTAAQLASRS